MPCMASLQDQTLTAARVQLFLGDTNRAISETPMNLASSRSHCIFTLHIETRQVRATCRDKWQWQLARPELLLAACWAFVGCC